MPRITTRTLPFLLISACSTLIRTTSAYDSFENSGNCADSSGWEEAKRIIETLLPMAEASSAINGDLGPFEDIFKDARAFVGGELDVKKANLSEPEENIGLSEEEEEEWEDYDEMDLRYADRFFSEIWNILHDEECMSGILDAESPDFELDDVLRVYDKCRLVHTRNFYPKDVLKDFKRNITSYVKGIASGRISEEGRTSYAGEMYYFSERNPYRYDLCFTEDLVNEELMLNDLLMRILQHYTILGIDMNMLDFGVIMAEPGAPTGHWHQDMGDYIFPSSFYKSRVAGHDLPPFAVAVITPLLDVTMEHGPTEFCMGTSNLAGIDSLELEHIPMKDPKLQELRDDFLSCTERCCPAPAWRAPLLEFGDVLLFDYTLFHRGGSNNSPDLRSLIYNTYARPWYKDPNFSVTGREVHATESPLSRFSEPMQELMKNVRFAIPDEIKPEDPDVLANIQFDDLEKQKQFRERHNELEEDEGEHGLIQFRVSNVDIDIEGLKACMRTEGDNVSCYAFHKGMDLEISAEAGTIIIIVAPGNKVIKSIRTHPKDWQGQIIVSSLNTKF